MCNVDLRVRDAPFTIISVTPINSGYHHTGLHVTGREEPRFLIVRRDPKAEAVGSKKQISMERGDIRMGD